MHQIAKDRNFEFLSTQYIGSSVKHKWRCQDGHEWMGTPSKIKNGCGCPICHTYIGEEKCRFVFEQLSGHLFPQLHRAFGTKMQIDGYCDQLKIAFEFHGKQHFHYVKYWHKGHDTLESQQFRDEEKRKLCKLMNVNLIEVPYDQNVEQLVAKSLSDVGILIQHVDWSLFKGSAVRLQQVCCAAEKIGLSCLEKTYVSAHHPMMFECIKCNRMFKSTSNNVKNGRGCAKCGGSMIKTIENMKTLAESRGLEFLSSKYINAKTKHTWKCLTCNYVWDTAPDNIRQGRSCPECGIKKQHQNLISNIDDIRKASLEKGVNFLSEKYKGAKIKHEWKCCKCSYTWLDTFSNIIYKNKGVGRSCPRCCGRHRTLEDLQLFASKKNLTLLSTCFNGNYEKLLYKCNRCTLEWHVTPHNIEHHSGCPKCNLAEGIKNRDARRNNQKEMAIY